LIDLRYKHAESTDHSSSSPGNSLKTTDLMTTRSHIRPYTQPPKLCQRTNIDTPRYR